MENRSMNLAEEKEMFFNIAVIILTVHICKVSFHLTYHRNSQTLKDVGKKATIRSKIMPRIGNGRKTKLSYFPKNEKVVAMVCEGISVRPWTRYSLGRSSGLSGLKSNSKKKWRGKHLAFVFCISGVPGVWWSLFWLLESWVGDITVVIAGSGLERSTRASDSAPAVVYIWALSYAVSYEASLRSFKRWLND